MSHCYYYINMQTESDNWKNKSSFYKEPSIISTSPAVDRIHRNLIWLCTFRSETRGRKLVERQKCLLEYRSAIRACVFNRKEVFIRVYVIAEASLIAPSGKCIPWGINLSAVFAWLFSALDLIRRPLPSPLFPETLDSSGKSTGVSSSGDTERSGNFSTAGNRSYWCTYLASDRITNGKDR